MRTMSRSQLAVLLFVTVGIACCASGGLGAEALLCLAPALLLAGSLFARRYPGEALLVALATRRRGRRERVPSVRARLTTRAVRVMRGGLLMGFGLAVRPPPLGPVAS